MRTARIPALAMGIWLAAAPAMAQSAAAPPSGDTNRSRSGAPDTPAAPAPPGASPEEIAHQAMVEEQERRDREAEAERDRDDQG